MIQTLKQASRQVDETGGAEKSWMIVFRGSVAPAHMPVGPLLYQAYTLAHSMQHAEAMSSFQKSEAHFCILNFL